MTKNSLIVTLDGPDVSEAGVLAEDFERVVAGVRTAMRLMVGYLGGREPGPGQPPAWVRDQSRLRLAPTRPGSYVAEFTHEPPVDTQMRMENLGQKAIAALCDWDGGNESSVPGEVADCLYDMAGSLSGSTRLWFGNSIQARRVQVTRPGVGVVALAESEDALLHGWLREVNWARRTAQLHDYSGDYVALRFGEALADDMLRLATQYVEVRGSGRFDKHDQWTSVEVESVTATGSWREPFDLEAFLNNPNPKIFDADKVVTIDLPDEEWEAFNRVIREGREA